MRLVAYLRVSTAEQAAHGYGLKVQERAARDWAKANGSTIVAVYRDEGVSGSNGVEDRVGLPAALEAVHDRRVDGIIVARFDRLARDLMVQEAILAKVWALGVELVTAEDGVVVRDDPDNPGRTFIRHVMGAVAQLDRALITKRLRDGRRAKADAGGYATGAPPLGQRAVGGTLVADPDEAATVDRIRELHVEGQSLRQIAAALEAEERRTKRGGRWQPETIRKVVARL